MGAEPRTCSEMPAELSNCHFTALEFTDKHVLEAAAPNFFQLRELVRGDLTILEAEAF